MFIRKPVKIIAKFIENGNPSDWKKDAYHLVNSKHDFRIWTANGFTFYEIEFDNSAYSRTKFSLGFCEKVYLHFKLRGLRKRMKEAEEMALVSRLLEKI